jgi:GH15 family glucan-1,4-alpha-glucosidase
MAATVARIEQDLLGRTGGVHRYRTDTFYGGGEWILLTALLGEYRAIRGDLDGAGQCLAYAESHASAEGYLPEQVTTGALSPEHIAEWTTRWGTPACPLLWSHAAYLALCARLRA